MSVLLNEDRCWHLLQNYFIFVFSLIFLFFVYIMKLQDQKGSDAQIVLVFKYDKSTNINLFNYKELLEEWDLLCRIHQRFIKIIWRAY